jgi:hypothetical protein
MLISLNRSRSAFVSVTPSSTFSLTFFVSSSSGSWDRKPMLMPACGRASPSYSLSRPAMILKSDDLPEPFKPSTPILAPGKKLRDMSLRINRLGGTILATAFIV